MASTPQTINAAVLASATDLYTAFVGAATRAMLVSLDLCNTTTSDVTIDVWYEASGGGTLRYFAKTFTVPAHGSITWRGMQVINAAGDKWRAQASATGVDALGAVIENA